MTEARRIAAEFLARPDPEFFKLVPEDAKRDSAMSLELSRTLKAHRAPALSSRQEEFIALGAPERVPAAAASTIPFLVGVRFSELTAWMCDIRQNAVLAVTRLSDGQTTLSLPFLPGDMFHRLRELPPSRSGPGPRSKDQCGYHTGVQSFDLRRLSPSIVDRPARLALRMIYHDFVSNGRVLEVTGDRPAASDQGRRAPASPFIKERADESPLPSSLTFPPKVKTDAPLSLEGCLDVAEKDIPVFDDERQPGRLVSPVTVLFLRLDDKDPLLVPAFVPVKTANGRIHAAFTLSVLSAVPHAELRGSYRVYLFAGTDVAGPYPLEVLP
jgi:hypothetical protein